MYRRFRHGQRHIFEDGLVVAGRGWNASIKLGSMLGRSTGCHGLPLTASPHRQDTERLRIFRLQLRFWLWFRPPRTPPHPPTPPLPLVPDSIPGPHSYFFGSSCRELLTKMTRSALHIAPLYFFPPKVDFGFNWPRIIFSSSFSTKLKIFTDIHWFIRHVLPLVIIIAATRQT